jgi:hypothetical protein
MKTIGELEMGKTLTIRTIGYTIVSCAILAIFL